MTVFHKTEPPWFEAVKDLKPGQKRRIGDGFLASFNGRAYMRFDFREKESEVYEPQLSLQQRLENQRAMREADEAATQHTELPELMLHPRDWPVAARAWLHKAGLNNHDISRLGAGWDPKMERVVIPQGMLDGSTGWIARAVGDWQDPKYLFPKGMRRGGGAYIRGMHNVDNLVVVTEDYLSGYRVALEGPDTLTANGTSLDRDAIVKIATSFSGVILWLDPDHWGQLGARRIGEDLRRYGVPTVNIISERDPKLHSPAEVGRYLKEAWDHL